MTFKHPEYIQAYKAKSTDKMEKLFLFLTGVCVTLIFMILLSIVSHAETRKIYDPRIKQYVVEVESPKEEIVSNPYQTISISDAEYEELRWVVALESSAKNFDDKKAVVETIFNRVLSQKNDWGSSVHEVLSKKGQFSTYKYIGSKKAWATPGESEDDAISEVLRSGITVLPRYSYVYFDSRGGVNGKNHIKLKNGNTYGEE